MSKYVYIAMSVFLLSVAVNAQVSYSVTLKPVKCVYKKTEGQTDYYQCEDKRGREYTRENLLKEPYPHKVLYGCKTSDNDYFLKSLWDGSRKCDELTKKFNRENREKILHEVSYALGMYNIVPYLLHCQNQYEKKLIEKKLHSSGLNWKTPITWQDIGMEPIPFEKGQESIVVSNYDTGLYLNVDICEDCFVCNEPQNGQGVSIVFKKDLKQSDCKRGLTLTRNISDNYFWLPVKITSPQRGDVCSESLSESLRMNGLNKEGRKIGNYYYPIDVGGVDGLGHKLHFDPNVWYMAGSSESGCLEIQNHTGVEDSLTIFLNGSFESIVLQEEGAGASWKNPLKYKKKFGDGVVFMFAKGGMYGLRESNCVLDADSLIKLWISKKMEANTFVSNESDPCKDLTYKATYVQENCKEKPEGTFVRGQCSWVYKLMKKERELACHSETGQMIDSRNSKKEKTGTSAQTESDRCKDLTNLVRYLQKECSALPKGSWERENCLEDYNYNKKRREQECLSGAEKKTDARDGKKNKTGTFVQSESDPCKELTDKARNLFEKCTALPEGNQSRERKDCMKEYRRVKKEEKRACH